jgi:hypothetical protein
MWWIYVGREEMWFSGAQLCGLLGMPQLVLGNFGLNLEVGEFITQTLRLYPQCFALLFPNLDFFLHHHSSLDCNIVF